MERLTWRDKAGVAYPHPKVLKSTINETMRLLCEPLATYEDTELSPEEVAVLEAKNEVLGQENDRLKAEVDRLHKENFWLTSSEREPQSGWIAMADKLPPEEGSYLVCTKLGAVCTAHFNVKTGRWGHSMYRITHWMPLPKPPEKGGD